MMIYEDAAMFSGRKGAALAGVAALHGAVICAFYSGFAKPIIQHFISPITITEIPKPRDKVTLRPEPPKLDESKLRLDPPQTGVNFPTDTDTAVAVERAPADPVPAGKETAAVPKVVGTGVKMDSKHPLKIGPDYYPAGAIRREQEGRCVVQVTVAVDGKVIDSSLQSSSGFPLLDEACLTAVRGQRMLPATQDGRAIQSTGSVPIVWKLTGSR